MPRPTRCRSQTHSEGGGGGVRIARKGSALTGAGLRESLRSPLPRAAVETFLDVFSTPALTWEALARAREWTSLPLLLKGIVHPDDAARAVDAGMDGVWCPTTAGGRSTAPCRRWRCCPRSCSGSAVGCRSSSTPACAAGPTPSSPSRSARPRSRSAARMPTVWASRARPGARGAAQRAGRARHHPRSVGAYGGRRRRPRRPARPKGHRSRGCPACGARAPPTGLSVAPAQSRSAAPTPRGTGGAGRGGTALTARGRRNGMSRTRRWGGQSRRGSRPAARTGAGSPAASPCRWRPFPASTSSRPGR